MSRQAGLTGLGQLQRPALSTGSSASRLADGQELGTENPGQLQQRPERLALVRSAA